MKRTHILFLLAATLAAGACAPDQPVQTGRQPIRLTSAISPTRGVQDSQIATGQTVYVWAQEGSDWGTPDGFIQGWELTAGSGGALTPSNGLTYYYPPQPLSLIVLHGNFSFADGQTPFPGIVSHSVLSDQSTAGNLEKSDLLHCRLDDVSASASPVGVAFAHKLSKIEITLSSSLYSAAELDAMTVTLNNVLPTVDLVLSSGAVGVAHGSTIAVHPRKTATAAANSGSAVFEAVIPAQPRPADFITVRLDGGVVNVDAQVSEFEANTRYPYDLDLVYLDVRLNPLWYVAEYNVNYDGSSTYSWASTLDEGYYFSWNDAQKAFTTAGNAAAATPASISGYYGDSGSKFAGWHLPTLTEWLSIVPGNQENIWEFDTGSGTYKATNTTVSFGYNKDTQAGMAEASYWKRASSTEMHALRYLGTPYCSAWRYVWANNMLTIYATLVGNVSASAAAASAWYSANWSGVFWGNDAAAGAVQRSLYLSGCITSGSGSTGVVEHDLNGRYQCATKDGSNVQTLCLSAQVGYMYSTGGVAYGRHTRLFRSCTRAKTTIEASLTSELTVGDIVCSNGYIYKAADAAEVKKEGQTAIGIIAFVNDGTAIGNAATESGLGRYTTKSKGRALVFCAQNLPSTYTYGVQVGTTYCSNNLALTDATYYRGYTRTASMNTSSNPATQAAYNFSAVSAPQNSTGWFLPSIGQWKLIITKLAEISAMSYSTWYHPANYMDTFDNKLKPLTTAGATTVSLLVGKRWYWSSTEYSDAGAASVIMGGYGAEEGMRLNADNRNVLLIVRPVLAF